jgi:hypothetical protein
VDVVETAIGVLVLPLALVSLVAFYIGFFGAFGGVRMVRCDRCGHLGMASPREPLRSCARCRHGRLLHPVAALHHGRQGHGSAGPDFR